jgi:hypothetical protein
MQDPSAKVRGAEGGGRRQGREAGSRRQEQAERFFHFSFKIFHFPFLILELRGSYSMREPSWVRNAKMKNDK